VACVQAGLESIAIVAIQFQNQVLGAIHLADRREERFSVGTMELIESVAPLIGEALLRFKMEKEILDLSERERQRLGRDLHDSLGGKLAGAALLSQALEKSLKAKSLPEASVAQEVIQCVKESIAQARSIGRGLCPVDVSGSGLRGSLEELARETQRRCGTSCRFEADQEVHIHDAFAASHLFRVAQESVSNAVRHGKPRHITIRLLKSGSQSCLEVMDDGKGIPVARRGTRGMGLQTMKYRAGLLGAELEVRRLKAGGTLVSCRLPAAAPSGRHQTSL
jgi:signal transduction histidine kinase